MSRESEKAERIVLEQGYWPVTNPRLVEAIESALREERAETLREAAAVLRNEERRLRGWYAKGNRPDLRAKLLDQLAVELERLASSGAANEEQRAEATRRSASLGDAGVRDKTSTEPPPAPSSPPPADLVERAREFLWKHKDRVLCNDSDIECAAAFAAEQTAELRAEVDRLRAVIVSAHSLWSSGADAQAVINAISQVEAARG